MGTNFVKIKTVLFVQLIKENVIINQNDNILYAKRIDELTKIRPVQTIPQKGSTISIDTILEMADIQSYEKDSRT